MTDTVKKRSLFSQSFHNGFANYANFTGRATRADFWLLWLSISIFTFLYFVLFIMLALHLVRLSTVIQLAKSLQYTSTTDLFITLIAYLYFAFLLAFIHVALTIPLISVSVRRLHDAGRSGWWLLLSLTVIGVLPLLIFFCLKSQPHDNAYGSAPRA